MYYIYENWRAEKKAIIHKGDCPFCNDGKGTGRNTLGEQNCRWHGAFSSYEEARKKAESLKNREVRDCKNCLK